MICVAGMSCSRDQGELSTAERDKVTEEVSSMFNDYFAAVKQGGLTKEFEFLDESEGFYWIPPGYKHPISFDSVKTFLIATAPVFLSVENSLDSIAIFPVSPTVARYVARIRSVTKDTSNFVSESMLLESGVVIKRSDGWKLLSGQTMLTDP
jgi:hypothetical protein